MDGLCWKGYEIHLGRTVFNITPEETLVKKDETLAVIDRRKKVIGTVIIHVNITVDGKETPTQSDSQ